MAKPDNKVPFTGGLGLGEYNFPPVMDGINYWVSRNDCIANPIVENHPNYELTSWKNSRGTTVIQRYLTDDGGHAWPSAAAQGRMGDKPSTALHVTNLMWEVFNRFEMH